MKNILILCTGNSCRSQIVHGYLSKMLKHKANVYSAGIETHGLNENAVKSMARDGIDISSHTSNNLKEYDKIDFAFIITVCNDANENCPFFPSKKSKRIHKNFLDPSKINDSKNIEKDFDDCRNKIKKFSLKFKKDFF
jgi:arsenate reductase|tara:strand:- start:1250 stop:1663 length:414 start_codon:yes stop_codon:yes gene_type:complete